MVIVSKNLTIRNATSDDASQLGVWWRDGTVMAHAGFPYGLSISDDEIKEDLASGSDEAGRVLIIEVDSRPIGEMNYRRIDNLTAEIGIKICDATQQEKGYGSILLSMLIDELFCNYKYERIVLDTNLNNVRAQHVYEKIGFRRVGIRNDCWKNQLGELQSAVDYEMYRYDYFFLNNYEAWDILDRNGNKTGRLHIRGRELASGDYHLIVNVWKHNGRGEWLINKRTSNRGIVIDGITLDGKWETTGGCAISGEDSLTAALRETKEELGLRLDPKNGIFFQHIARKADNGHTYFQDVWVFEHDCSFDDVVFQENETCEAIWATPDIIRKMMANGEFVDTWHYPYFEEMMNNFSS